MGIKIGVKWRDAELPDAYMGIGQVNGSAKNGWNGQVRVFASKAARDAGQQSVFDFSINTGEHGSSAPGLGGGAPVTLKDAPAAPTTAAVPSDPYVALYTKLKGFYPGAVRVD